MRITGENINLEKYRLQAAMYKALFYNKSELADKIRDQLKENYNNTIGEFDCFCYDSCRADAVYRTLENMAIDRLISNEDYQFCQDETY